VKTGVERTYVDDVPTTYGSAALPEGRPVELPDNGPTGTGDYPQYTYTEDGIVALSEVEKTVTYIKG